MPTISASAARQSFTTQLDRVEAGEEVAITRHGRVVAVMVRPDVLSTRRARAAWDRADRVGELLAQARDEPLPKPAIDQQRAQALVSAIRRERGRR